MFPKEERSIELLETKMREVLKKVGINNIDYARIVDSQKR